MLRTAIILTLLLVLTINQGSGQCRDADWHSTSLTDLWISCEARTSPVAGLPVGHWIQYELEQPVTISQIKLWNIAHPDQSQYGTNAVRIDYSLDGSSWSQWTTQEMASISDPYVYSGELIEGLEPFTAQYIVLTNVDPKDPGCSGLAEVKFILGDATTPTIDILDEEILSVYPNPADLSINVDLDASPTQEIRYSLYTTAGQVVLQQQGAITEVIDVAQVPDGTYILKASFDNSAVSKQVVIIHP